MHNIHKALILASLIVISSNLVNMSFSEIEEDSVKDCKVGKYGEYFSLGSWVIKITNTDA